jgi:hypothetical protein
VIPPEAGQAETGVELSAARRIVPCLFPEKDVHPSGSLPTFHSPLCDYYFIVLQSWSRVKHFGKKEHYKEVE